MMIFLATFKFTELLQGAASALIFGVIGIALMVLGFKAFDWITPKLDVEKELSEKNNLAVAIVIGAVILGVSYIVGKIISSPD